MKALDTNRGILRTAEFEISEKDLLWLALADYRSGKGDFSDYYLGRANERAGAKGTLSFDTALKGEPRFQILAPLLLALSVLIWGRLC